MKAYDDMIKGIKADLDSPTWKNLIRLFNEAKIDLNKCLFSNVFMGLRDTEKMTGKFPGFKDEDFVSRNLKFLSYQIKTIKPKLIITLGKYAAEMLSRLSKPDLDCWQDGGALRIPNEGYKINIKFESHVCSCIALEHTSMRNSNVKRRVYENHSGYEAEVKMLEDAIKNKDINKAYDKLQVMSKDEKSRMAYEAREAEIHDQMTRIKTAREEGMYEKAIRVAENLLTMGLTNEQIALAAELPIEKIIELKNKMNN